MSSKIEKALVTLLNKIWHHHKEKELRILISGKTGQGKSTLVNGILGDKVAREGAGAARCTTEVEVFSKTVNHVPIKVFDSPGLQDRLAKEEEYIQGMTDTCQQLSLVLYCTKMINTRLTDDDKNAMTKLTRAFGENFWNYAVFVLTFANQEDVTRRDDRDDPNEVEPHEKDTKGWKELGKRRFQHRLKLWEEGLQRFLIEEVGVSSKIARDIPVIPTGDHKRSLKNRRPFCLPDRKNWFEDFWKACCLRVKETGLFLQVNSKRLYSLEAESEQSSEHGQENDEDLITLHTAIMVYDQQNEQTKKSLEQTAPANRKTTPMLPPSEGNPVPIASRGAHQRKSGSSIQHLPKPPKPQMVETQISTNTAEANGVPPQTPVYQSCHMTELASQSDKEVITTLSIEVPSSQMSQPTQQLDAQVVKTTQAPEFQCHIVEIAPADSPFVNSKPELVQKSTSFETLQLVKSLVPQHPEPPPVVQKSPQPQKSSLSLSSLSIPSKTQTVALKSPRLQPPPKPPPPAVLLPTKRKLSEPPSTAPPPSSAPSVFVYPDSSPKLSRPESPYLSSECPTPFDLSSDESAESDSESHPLPGTDQSLSGQQIDFDDEFIKKVATQDIKRNINDAKVANDVEETMTRLPLKKLGLVERLKKQLFHNRIV